LVGEASTERFIALQDQNSLKNVAYSVDVLPERPESREVTGYLQSM
jgi:hypothetical protein